MTLGLEGPAPEVDPRPRRLLERFVSLTGGMAMETGPELLEVELPWDVMRELTEAPRLVVALSPSAMDEEPGAEILVVGSELLGRLVGAIRRRGSHDDRGLVPSAVDPSPEAVQLTVPVEGATPGTPSIDLVALPVGRLVARVTIHSGPTVVERLVESSIVDLTVGTPAADAVAQACAELPSSEVTAVPAAARPLRSRPPGELLPLLFADLERQLEAELASIRESTARASSIEIARLDAYYQRMLEEIDPEEDPDEVLERKAAITADRARRVDDEERRAALRVTVHPVQLIEWRVLAQRAEWPIDAPTGADVKIASTRTLVGDTRWHLACPSCGAAPQAIRVCHEGHASCDACSERCGVCGEACCRTHGLTTCELEGHPACARHASPCPSCGRVHCNVHAGRCQSQDHVVCSSCLVSCARCGMQVCESHGTLTSVESPLGARWLCSGCTVHCEGGTNEKVGLDEVERCTSCDRHVCHRAAHRMTVDEQLHCSRHLRRSDRSGRLVCESHRASCADEPDAILAADEVSPCRTCNRMVCESHSGICTADAARHCTSHLMPLRDQPGHLACEVHRTVCSVDGVGFSLTGTTACPVCGKPACAGHMERCRSCARPVCVRDVEARICLTCRRLAGVPDPEDALIAAAIEANRGEPPSARQWRTARDGSHTVVEVDLGWRRRLVFTVAHSETRPATVVYHSLLGSERRR